MTDTTTEQFMKETGHNCVACPTDVRGLYAVAHNALGQWDAIKDSVADGRMHRKMSELRSSVESFRTIVNEHFEALNAWRKP